MSPERQEESVKGIQKREMVSRWGKERGGRSKKAPSARLKGRYDCVRGSGNGGPGSTSGKRGSLGSVGFRFKFTLTGDPNESLKSF